MQKLTAQIFHLSAPNIANQVLSFLAFFLASILVGRISSLLLSALALSYFYYIVLYVFALGIMFAVGIKVSENHGAANKEEIQIHAAHGIWLAIFIGIIGAILFMHALPFFKLAHQNLSIATQASSYLYFIAFSFPGAVINIVLQQILMGIGRPAMINVFIVIRFIVIVIGYYPFVYGHWGMPAILLAYMCICCCCSVIACMKKGAGIMRFLVEF